MPPKNWSRPLQTLLEWSLTLTGEPEQVLARIVKQLADILTVSAVGVAEIQGEQLQFLALSGVDAGNPLPAAYPLALSPCATVVQQQTLCVYDAVQTLFTADTFLQQQQAVAYCGCPVFDSAGAVLAVICVLDTQAHDFNAAAQDILQRLAPRIGMEIVRQRDLARQQQEYAQLRRDEQDLRQALQLSQQQTEQACHHLQTKDAIFHAFMNSSSFLAWMKDETGRISYVNQPFETYFKLSAAECIGKTDFELFPPARRMAVMIIGWFPSFAMLTMSSGCGSVGLP